MAGNGNNEKKIDAKIEFVALSDLQQKPQEKEYLKPEEILNKTIVIFRVAFYQGVYGDYAVAETDMGFFRTSSKVLIKQLSKIQAAIEQLGIKGVRATLRKRVSARKREYYIFE